MDFFNSSAASGASARELKKSKSSVCGIWRKIDFFLEISENFSAKLDVTYLNKHRRDLSLDLKQDKMRNEQPANNSRLPFNPPANNLTSAAKPLKLPANLSQFL